MILIIDICEHRLHSYEFVKPIEDIVRSNNFSYKTVHYSELSSELYPKLSSKPSKLNLDKFSRIIICGTSLRDFKYAGELDRFRFIKDYDKPVLGICGGMQILCTLYGCRLVNGSEIGLVNTEFRDFLGISAYRMIYCLHNLAVRQDAAFNKNFKAYARTRYVQAIKHKSKQLYGVLSHPEARNKDFIVNFLYDA